MQNIISLSANFLPAYLIALLLMFVSVNLMVRQPKDIQYLSGFECYFLFVLLIINIILYHFSWIAFLTMQIVNILVFVFVFIKTCLLKALSFDFNYAIIRRAFQFKLAATDSKQKLGIRIFFSENAVYMVQFSLLASAILFFAFSEFIFTDIILLFNTLFTLLLLIKSRSNQTLLRFYSLSLSIHLLVFSYLLVCHYFNNIERVVAIVIITSIVAVIIYSKGFRIGKSLIFSSLSSKPLKRSRSLGEVHVSLPLAEKKVPVADTFLNKPNIIVITFESLSQKYFDMIIDKGKTPLYNYLKPISSHSCYHSTICPMTAESLYNMFFGDYKLFISKNSSDSRVSYLETLKESQYKTFLVSPSYICDDFNDFFHLAHYDDSVNRGQFNFSSISDLDFYKHTGDLIVDKLKQSNQYFMHIKSEQTHYPYGLQTENLKKYPPGSLMRYLQAFAETEDAVNYLLEKIDKKIGLANTLIVYTGDHGESFGEFGNVTHGALTKSGLNVPFLFYHPKLAAREIQFSTHFDIFPTIFSRLGLPYVARYGEDVYKKHDCEKHFSHFLHGSFVRGDVPYSLGHINSKRKIYFDLRFNYFLKLDLNDNVVRNLSKREIEFYKEYFWERLKTDDLLA